MIRAANFGHRLQRSHLVTSQDRFSSSGPVKSSESGLAWATVARSRFTCFRQPFRFTYTPRQAPHCLHVDSNDSFALSRHLGLTSENGPTAPLSSRTRIAPVAARRQRLCAFVEPAPATASAASANVAAPPVAKWIMLPPMGLSPSGEVNAQYNDSDSATFCRTYPNRGRLPYFGGVSPWSLQSPQVASQDHLCPSMTDSRSRSTSSELIVRPGATIGTGAEVRRYSNMRWMRRRQPFVPALSRSRVFIMASLPMMTRRALVASEAFGRSGGEDWVTAQEMRHPDDTSQSVEARPRLVLSDDGKASPWNARGLRQRVARGQRVRSASFTREAA